MQTYQPPFTITPAIINLIANISEGLGRLSILEDDKNLRLRRINRIRTIQGSLAIEDNTPQEIPQVTPQVKRLIEALANTHHPISRNELQSRLKLRDRKSFRERYLKPALDNSLITMTIPDKPNSYFQQYILTDLGQQIVDS